MLNDLNLTIFVPLLADQRCFISDIEELEQTIAAAAPLKKTGDYS
jgi:hypothetical protein